MSVQYGSVIGIGDRQGSKVENFDSDAEMVLEEQSVMNVYESNNNSDNDGVIEIVTNENVKDIDMDEEDLEDEEIKDVEDDILEIGVADGDDNDEELLDFIEEEEEEEEDGSSNDQSVEVILDGAVASVDDEKVREIENDSRVGETIEESIEIFSDSEEVAEAHTFESQPDITTKDILKDDNEDHLKNSVVPDKDEAKLTIEDVTKPYKQKGTLLKQETPQVETTLPILLETEVSRCFLLKPPDSIPMTIEQLEYFPILFKDDSIISQNLDSIFELIRHTEELKDDFENEDELILTIDQLELSISEDNYYAGDVSITDLINLKLKYNKKHNIESTFENLDELALTLKLSCQRRFITQFNKLCSESIDTPSTDEHIKSDDEQHIKSDDEREKQEAIKTDEKGTEENIDDKSHEQDIISDEEDILDEIDEIDEEESNKRSFESTNEEDGDDDDELNNVKKFKKN